MRNNVLKVVLLTIAFVFFISGCGGGSSSSSSSSVSSAKCDYLDPVTKERVGVIKETYKPTGLLDSLITDCDFARIYRGAPAGSQSAYGNYPTWYSDYPSISKGTTGSYNYYSYANLIAAYNHLFGLYPAEKPFASGDYMKDMRELSAFLANIGQETTGNYAPQFFANNDLNISGALGNGYGLYAITEGSCAINGCAAYGTKRSYCTNQYPVDCNASLASAASSNFCKLAKGYCDGVYPANDNVPSAQYFGRGSKQLSYPYNYMYYSTKIFPSDPYKLGNNPSIMDTNGTLGWETGLAFWALPYEDIYSTRPSMHDGFFNPTNTGKAEFDALVGFGKTVNIINGGVECGKKFTFLKTQTLNRINNYIELLFLNHSRMPVDRVEVTRLVNEQTVVDTYTKDDLLHNISTDGVFFKDYDYNVTASSSAPNLIKKYRRNGQTLQSDYSGAITDKYRTSNSTPPTYQLSYAYNANWGVYGRYNSQPFLQEYYAPKNSIVSGANTVYMTDITKIILYYDTNSSYNTQNIAQERLDCTGVQNFEGN